MMVGFSLVDGWMNLRDTEHFRHRYSCGLAIHNKSDVITLRSWSSLQGAFWHHSQTHTNCKGIDKRLVWYTNTKWLNGMCHHYLNIHEHSSLHLHCSDVIMSAIASQITSPTIVYSIIYSGVEPKKQQSSASLAFVRGILKATVSTLSSLQYENVCVMVTNVRGQYRNNRL